jgi:hypothetical protein
VGAKCTSSLMVNTISLKQYFVKMFYQTISFVKCFAKPFNKINNTNKIIKTGAI